ncbi:MAG: SUMF1/EgtB/PvdO family nonheme iron enzyme [Planctomycetota bacterium]
MGSEERLTMTGAAGEVAAATAGDPPFRAVVEGTKRPPPQRLEQPRAEVKLDEASIRLGGGGKRELVKVPVGAFLMGSLGDEPGRDGDDGPALRVRIEKPSRRRTYEVTQAEWHAVMGSRPSEFEGSWNPVETVPWNDRRESLRKSNARVAGGSFRRPAQPALLRDVLPDVPPFAFVRREEMARLRLDDHGLAEAGQRVEIARDDVVFLERDLRARDRARLRSEDPGARPEDTALHPDRRHEIRCDLRECDGRRRGERVLRRRGPDGERQRRRVPRRLRDSESPNFDLPPADRRPRGPKPPHFDDGCGVVLDRTGSKVGSVRTVCRLPMRGSLAFRGRRR